MKKKRWEPHVSTNMGCNKKNIGQRGDKGKQMRQNLEMHQFQCIFEFCLIFFCFFFLCVPFDTREDYKIEITFDVWIFCGRSKQV